MNEDHNYWITREEIDKMSVDEINSLDRVLRWDISEIYGPENLRLKLEKHLAKDKDFRDFICKHELEEIEYIFLREFHSSPKYIRDSYYEEFERVLVNENLVKDIYSRTSKDLQDKEVDFLMKQFSRGRLRAKKVLKPILNSYPKDLMEEFSDYRMRIGEVLAIQRRYKMIDDAYDNQLEVVNDLVRKRAKQVSLSKVNSKEQTSTIDYEKST